MKRSLKVERLDSFGYNQPIVSKSTSESSLDCDCTSCTEAHKMADPDPDNISFPEDAYFGEGSIPRAQLAKRPPLPLPSRTRNESGNHYYASAGTLQRDAEREIPSKNPAPQPPPRASMYGNYLNVQDPEYAEKMSRYLQQSSKKHADLRNLQGLAAAIGFIGIVLSAAALLSYLAVQAPHLRRTIGPFYASDFHREWNDTDISRTTLPTPNVIYGLELGGCIILGLLLILTDALLSKLVLPPLQKKYPVRLWRRFEKPCQKIRNFVINKNSRSIYSASLILTTFCSKTPHF